MHFLGNTGTLAAGKNNVGVFEHDIVIGGICAGCQQNQASASSFYILLEICKRAVALKFDFVEVIESCAS